MSWLQWCLVCSTVLLSVAAGADECPIGNSCKLCEKVYGENRFIMTCRDGGLNFMIDYIPEDFIIINCLGRGDLTTFDLGSVKKVKPVEAIVFRHCSFSQEVNVGRIVNNIFNAPVDEVRFLQCTNVSNVVTQEGLKGLTKLKYLDLRSNGLTKMASEPFKKLPNITGLNFMDNSLNELPLNFFNAPSLERIDLGMNELEVIKRETFEKLERLRFLNLWRNKIAEIEANAFDNNLELESIDIFGNKLSSLPSGLFSKLPKLKVINLAINNFTADSFPVDLFRYNKQLKSVILTTSKRKVTTLPNGFFSGLTQLEQLMLFQNGFDQIPEDLIWGAEKLRILYLQENSISTIPEKFFKDCEKLENLKLNDNKIQHLPNGIFSSLKELKVLKLSGNPLQIPSLYQVAELISLKPLEIKHDLEKELKHLRFANSSHN